MEQKNYNRSPVRLDATVHDDMYRSWDFVIEDFGFDGLRLAWNNRTLMPNSFGIGDLLDVQFAIANNGKTNSSEETVEYHLEVKIVRVLDSELAVTLFNPALDAISFVSKEQLQAGMHSVTSLSNTLNKRSLNILDAVRHSFMKNMSHMTDVFLPVAHDSLFQQADSSSNNAEQALYFDAINTLNKSKSSLKNEFLNLLKKCLNLCCKKDVQAEKNQNFDELQLIDQNEFENWLAVNQLIIRISPNYEQELLEIEQRLAKLMDVDVKEIEQNPFSPENIFNSFSEAIHHHFLNNNIILILYQQFEKIVDNQLFQVYKEINQIFIEQNVLPIIEQAPLEIVKELSVKVESSVKDEPQLSSNVQPPVINSPVSSPLQQQAFNAHLSEINTIKNDVNLVPAYQTLKELLSFQSGQGVDKPSDDYYSSHEYQEQLEYFISDLSKIQHQQAKEVALNDLNSFDLESLIDDCIKKDIFSIDLQNEFKYTQDIIKRLFVSIEEDSWLGDPVKKLLASLQIPLLKVALLHKDFFESWSNPARIFINKLAMVDFDDEKNSFYLKAHSFVLYVLKNYDTNLNVFTKVQAVLTELLEIQTRHYQKNVIRIVAQWDAQQIVVNEIAIRLAGKSIPEAIADFISHQWLPILVSTYLKHGKESNLWDQYFQAMDMLILSVAGDVNEDFIDKDTILFIIKQGLEENKQHCNKKIIDTIELCLSGVKSSEKILLDSESIIKLLINGSVLSDKLALSKINLGATDAKSLANKSIAKRLKINDYLVFKQRIKQNSNQDTNKINRLQYVWGSDAQNIFVFSGRSGQQKAVFNLSEVVAMLDSGQLTQTKDYSLPLLERSLYAILGDVHDNLARGSALDKLTGLINQREFIRQMTAKLNNRTVDAPELTLCMINIDQFSLINDTCGYEGGDQYIAEIAREIKYNLPADSIFSRYSTDEFIVLLSDHSPEEALEVSESQRKLIQNYHFKIDNKKFTMSASIGQVAISELNEVSVFIKAVITAATIAKETGRNRVHLIEYDALELNYRQELQQWATKVDHMVENNRLDIRCQRLQPISDDNLLQHYEMLLLIKDENNDHMPPAEFIEAAELYNKMAEVDRWVIKFVFDWFSKHPEQLKIMGGIAINLSGQSLNDVDFFPFILNIFEQYPNIPHEQICFEITETMAVTNLTHANNIIHSLKEKGCKFSLDDFGTGQSSYAYLKNLPVDYLKIDGVFIKDLVNSPADRAMVKSINEIGHFLGMKTVAEFVEDLEIVEVLKEIGVDYAQGYGIEKPILISKYMDANREEGGYKALN